MVADIEAGIEVDNAAVMAVDMIADMHFDSVVEVAFAVAVYSLAP